MTQSDDDTDRPDAERPGMVPYGNVDTALRRETDVVAERFPDTDRAVIENAVHEVFGELREIAKVEVHVLALTRNRVYDRLIEEGHRFQPATDAADTNEVNDTAEPTES